MARPKARDGDATSTVTVHKDHADGFTRTAIVLGASDEKGGSIDFVTPDGTRIAQVNCFYDGASLMVDVIDVDGKFAKRTALTFNRGMRDALDCGDCKIVAADFRNPAPKT